MKIKILGTGSTGNAYVLQDSNENCLIIEAGVPAKPVARACNYNAAKIKGLLVSHAHGDHAKYLHSYAMSFFSRNGLQSPVMHLKKDCPYAVQGFEVHHDVETLGFVIDHPECGRIVYASDMRQMPYKFGTAATLLVEANYSEEILAEREATGRINKSLAARIRENHMSIERLVKYLRHLPPGTPKTVVLLHLSDANSDECDFKQRIQRATGCTVYVADSNKEFTI